MSCWSDKFSTWPTLTIFSKSRYLTNLSKVTSRCELSNIWATFWGGMFFFLNKKKILSNRSLETDYEMISFLENAISVFVFFICSLQRLWKRVGSNYFLNTEKPSTIIYISIGSTIKLNTKTEWVKPHFFNNIRLLYTI